MEVLSVMFKRLKDPKFVIIDRATTVRGLYIRWNFSFKNRFIKSGEEHAIQGVSFIEADSSGKICKHTDYWDAASELYTYIPVLGRFFSLIRRFFK